MTTLDTLYEQAVVTMFDMQLSNFSEPPCESKHTYSVCSVKVTHRVIWCRGAINVCHASVRSQREWLGEHPLGKCAHCKALAKNCWRIFPI